MHKPGLKHLNGLKILLKELSCYEDADIIENLRYFQVTEQDFLAITTGMNIRIRQSH